MNLATFGARYEKVIVFVVAALTVLGVYAYTTIPASIFPNMSFSRIDVVADAGNLPPDQVRTSVALPLEQAFQGLPSVTRVRSTSAQGNAELIVEFDPSTNVQGDLTYVDQAIAATQNQLPPAANVQASIINPNREPVVIYALTSSTMSQTLLHELAQQSMVPRFYGAPDLGKVSVTGGPPREFHIQLNASALAQYGLTISDVSAALSSATQVTPVGQQVTHYVRNVVVVDAGVRTARDLGRIMVPTKKKGAVPISALGSIVLGVAPKTSDVSFDATPAVLINFYALPGADAVKMADAISTRASAIAASLPAGTKLTRFWDQTVLVKESQASLRDAILIGALLAILVIFVFLRNLRMTLVAAIVIPIAMAIAVFVIGRAGETLNLMSVGGLAIAVGLIIDDAIVVIENIARNHHANPSANTAEVIKMSMSQIGSAMVASTTTTVVVFVPLALLTGVSGFFFRSLALTLASSLIVSLALALFLAPVLAKWLIRPKDQDHEGHGDFIGRILERYEPVLRWALNNRRLVYAGSVVVLIVTVVLLMRLPSDFLPKLDEGQFEIGYQLPVGTSLQASSAAAQRMEELALRDPAVRSVGRWTGLDTNGISPMPQNQGIVRVRLKPANERAGYEAISGRLNDVLSAAFPGAQFDFHQILEDMINDVSGAPAPLEIELQGPDQRTLVKYAQIITGKMSSVKGVADAFSGVVYTDPTIRVAPDQRRLAELGVQSSSLADALAAQTQGTVATSIPGANMLVPVRISLANADLNLAQNNVNTSSGPVGLPNLARIAPAQLSTSIFENNGQRELLITASIRGASLSSAVAGVKKAIADAHLPPGYTTVIGGEYAAQQQSFREFAAVIAIAVALVFAVMLATFRSFRLPLVILTAIPLALIGVALGLFLTRTPFNVSSFMGLLLLVGIVVKNGILLIDVANQRRLGGDSVENALVTAGRTRLRPIVMTTFAAIGGLLPLALGIGSGAAMEKPLAIAVIGGLSTATAFTLIVIPVLYAGFSRGEQLVAEHAPA
ncbi:MAG TPA: efflux RND transporter permease subunit [Candidatus Aquilonibacter sp.]|nr:efflux RND transporter permease subunit [Candidatus Aquilonibacter sp.]